MISLQFSREDKVNRDKYHENGMKQVLWEYRNCSGLGGTRDNEVLQRIYTGTRHRKMGKTMKVNKRETEKVGRGEEFQAKKKNILAKSRGEKA